MPNTVNYVTLFEQEIQQKYTKDLLTAGLTTSAKKYSFTGAKTIKVPWIQVSGYKDHNRNGGFNRGTVENRFMTFELGFDRDVEFWVDPMDVDESNQALAAGNVTSVFLKEQAIPETDAYRISKIYSEYSEKGGTTDATALTAANILSTFDRWMEEMDEAEVPSEGRIMYLTPAVNTLIKTADKITRTLEASGATKLDRRIYSLDDVKIQKIPSGRMKTLYDFGEGYKPAEGAKQVNMILVHPSAVLACDKHSYINLFAPGSDSRAADGYLYQNRRYGDLFLFDNRLDGVKINVS